MLLLTTLNKFLNLILKRIPLQIMEYFYGKIPVSIKIYEVPNYIEMCNREKTES